MFSSTGTRLKLIGKLLTYFVNQIVGLIEQEKLNDITQEKYIYAPFGKLISEQHKGVYICNNKNIKKWIGSKGGSE